MATLEEDVTSLESSETAQAAFNQAVLDRITALEAQVPTPALQARLDAVTAQVAVNSQAQVPA